MKTWIILAALVAVGCDGSAPVEGDSMDLTFVNNCIGTMHVRVFSRGVQLGAVDVATEKFSTLTVPCEREAPISYDARSDLGMIPESGSWICGLSLPPQVQLECPP
jgi:hypothetical protein